MTFSFFPHVFSNVTSWSHNEVAQETAPRCDCIYLQSAEEVSRFGFQRPEIPVPEKDEDKNLIRPLKERSMRETAFLTDVPLESHLYHASALSTVVQRKQASPSAFSLHFSDMSHSP